MTAGAPVDRASIVRALDLPADADDAAVVERIEAMRLVREAATLDRVRGVLCLPADASPLACAVELCRRLPPWWHHVAALAMRVIEVNERGRALRVDLIRREAIDAARGGATG